MVSTKEFQSLHADPLPFDYTATDNASMIRFKTKGEKEGYAFYAPSDKPTKKVLIIFHEWWGLNDYIKQEVERWQQMLGEVEVYAPDLYDGKLATTADEASKLVGALDGIRAENIIQGLLEAIGEGKEIATLGWCMGGSWAFTAGVLAGKQTKGIVMYYGFPENDIARIKPLKADVLYIWASRDRSITKDKVTAFQKNVTSTGNRFYWHSFDAVHAFANPSNPKHDAKKAMEAGQLTLDFLRKKLKLK